MLLSHDEDTIKKIENIVDSFRPGFAVNGGDIIFIKYERNIVFVNMIGTYVGYPSNDRDVLSMIEREIRMIVPEVEAVKIFTYQ